MTHAAKVKIFCFLFLFIAFLRQPFSGVDPVQLWLFVDMGDLCGLAAQILEEISQKSLSLSQNYIMTLSSDIKGLTLDISIDQLLRALLQLPVEEKIRIADRLRAAAAAERLRQLQLPDISDISMEEIVEEVKAVRKDRSNKK